ncbi:efflux RND transporter periplasmic adaptor subunit [Bacillus carboniphilus]|uniref:Efflux RND transporter periplasmic adaptor subunit n=1 Tax=Bacillus carboniphilus TaxID=86663 RepID=A0ABY9JV01_9BACI|nr:efflux RND transporter periplasmic adaptor subunit [Bacillus carboniphilus]WLR43237.1 efflux RND transporter periplasmic adaptor subunit [Bacillus carboniphilus]
MSKAVKIIIGIVIVLAIGGFVGLNIYQQKEETAASSIVETVSLEKEEIVQNVMVPGTLELTDEQRIYFEVDKGKVKEIFVKKGDKVKEGTKLVEYENQQVTLEKEQNALEVESSNLQLKQYDSQMDDLKDEQKELEKQIGEDEAKKQIDEQREQLKLDKKIAELSLKQTDLQKQTIEKAISDLTVKSEINGVVVNVDETAMNPSMQDAGTLIHVANMDSMQVTGVISEYDTLKVKKDQPVKLTSEVLPEKEWKGKVSYIGDLPEGSALGEGGGAVQYSIIVAVEEASKMEAKPGFQLLMEIETERREVETLPLEAVQQEGEDYFVYLVQEGVAIKQPVTVGSTSEEFIEIVEGVTDSDVIINNPDGMITDGMEVSVE